MVLLGGGGLLLMSEAPPVGSGDGDVLAAVRAVYLADHQWGPGIKKQRCELPMFQIPPTPGAQVYSQRVPVQLYQPH